MTQCASTPSKVIFTPGWSMSRDTLHVTSIGTRRTQSRQTAKSNSVLDSIKMLQLQECNGSYPHSSRHSNLAFIHHSIGSINPMPCSDTIEIWFQVTSPSAMLSTTILPLNTLALGALFHLASATPLCRGLAPFKIVCPDDPTQNWSTNVIDLTCNLIGNISRIQDTPVDLS